MALKSWLRRLVGLGLGSIAIATFASVARADVHVTFLGTGQSETYEGYFLADEEIYASCDENCEDLDIYLYDAYTEELVASDTLTDAYPIVVAPYEGTFWVEMMMVTCYADACEVWTDSTEGF